MSASVSFHGRQPVAPPPNGVTVHASWFQCRVCLYVTDVRSGMCNSCGDVNTFVEVETSIAMKFRSAGGYGRRSRRSPVGESGGGFGVGGVEQTPFSIGDPESGLAPEEEGEDEDEDEDEDEGDEDEDEEQAPPPRKPPPRVEVQHLFRVKGGTEERIATGVEVFDNLLSGGPPNGFCILLAAMPGSGKSTLFRECAASLAQLGYRVMYASGEETAKQARNEFKRMGLFKRFPKSTTPAMKIVCANNPDSIIAAAYEHDIDVLFVDSISTMASLNVAGEMGKEKQVKYAAYHFSQAAHAENEYKGRKPMVVYAIAHATKDGDMAGPNAAKHWVDGACMMEHIDPISLALVEDQTEPTGYVRIRINGKYRAGSALKKAYMQMTAKGLREYKPKMLAVKKGAAAATKPGAISVKVSKEALARAAKRKAR